MPAKKSSGGGGKAERVISGSDSEGRKYASTDEMWAQELKGDLYSRDEGWYGKALNYWSKAPATVNGVLGGMEHIHGVDIAESRSFIESLPDRGTERALDCGAGIGRITKNLLAALYATTDVMEPVEHMIAEARRELAGLSIGEFMQCSMEQARLEPGRYDLIVIQWAAIYLTDDDFVKFFAHCKQALTPRGYIFFKENCSSSDKFLVDKEDSSLTRSDRHYKRLFAKAGVSVIKEEDQKDWPSGLLKVRMYALK